MNQPFWEEAYARDDVNAFSAEANPTLREFEHLIPRTGAVLEAGCGEGQNVLHLARQGFTDIDAFDISEAGVAKVRRRCEREGLQLNAFVGDLTKYDFRREYDLIMTFGTLHFVTREEWHAFLERSKVHTRPGGLHIVQIFIDVVPITPDLAPFAKGMARDGELRDCYGDWEILQFRSYIFDDQHGDMPKHQHAANKLVARRIR